MSFSDFQIKHGMENLDEDLQRRALRKVPSRKARLLTKKDFIPGFNRPIGFLPALPSTGMVSAKGVDLGGFQGAVEVMNCSAGEWAERLKLANVECARVYSSKGVGRNAVWEDRESTCEQVHGNLRHDVTFALRRGSRCGLNVEGVLRQALREVAPAMEEKFPGVRVVGLLAHYPNPWRSDDIHGAAMNPHLQGYTVRAFRGHWLGKHRHGFTQLTNVAVAGLQQAELGIDVHAYARQRHLVDTEWWLTQASENEVLEIGDEVFRIRCSEARARLMQKETSLDEELSREISRWDGFWKPGKNKLSVYQKELATASKAQGAAVNWWLSSWFTHFLQRRLPEVDPRWTEFLDWGSRAAKWVLEKRIETKFQISMIELLERYEAASDATDKLLNELRDFLPMVAPDATGPDKPSKSTDAPVELRNKVADLTQQVTSLGQQLEEANRLLVVERLRGDKVSAEVAALRAEKDEITHQLAKAQQDVVGKAAEVKSLQMSVSQLRAELKQAKDDLEGQVRTATAAEAELWNREFATLEVFRVMVATVERANAEKVTVQLPHKWRRYLEQDGRSGQFSFRHEFYDKLKTLVRHAEAVSELRKRATAIDAFAHRWRSSLDRDFDLKD